MTPILPFINDTPENIKEIIYQAHLANANFIYPMFGVTLRDRQREYFYTQLDKLFPSLKEHYVKQFGNNYLCNSPRLYELKRVFIEECQKYNLTYKMEDIIAGYKHPSLLPEQLSLF